jgi:PleD family two-component response regulator
VFSSTLSIGLTSVSEQGDDMQSLVRKADMGLFVAKESGRNSVKVSL